jgi:hypothetical protein
LKVLKGNPGKRPIEPEKDVPAPEGEVVRPASLKGTAAEFWDEYAPVCIGMGTLTVADVPSFEVLCVLKAEFDRVGALMSASHIAQMRMLSEAFCMTAPSRVKNGSGGGKKDKANPAESYFGT